MIMSKRVYFYSDFWFISLVTMFVFSFSIEPIFAESAVVVKGSIKNVGEGMFTQGCSMVSNRPQIKISQTLYGRSKFTQGDNPGIQIQYFKDKEFNTLLHGDIGSVIEGETTQTSGFAAEFVQSQFKDAYLQLIPIGPKGEISLRFEKGNYIGIVSSLPKISLPKNGSIHMALPSLKSGKYVIVAQNLLPEGAGVTRTQFLTTAEKKSIAYFTIKDVKSRADPINLGDLCIPPPTWQ